MKSNIVNELRVRLDAVREEIERRKCLTTRGIFISDHAVLRYLERHKGIDMKSIREEIAEMAYRSGKPGSGEQYARRDDDATGLTLGLNEVTNVVTTIFSAGHRTIMDIPDPRKQTAVKADPDGGCCQARENGLSMAGSAKLTTSRT